MVRQKCFIHLFIRPVSVDAIYVSLATTQRHAHTYIPYSISRYTHTKIVMAGGQTLVEDDLKDNPWTRAILRTTI